MILRRISDAIKKQDWFQVTIEILIVVIGIFLGLQVTQWNEGRIDKIEERRILGALTHEVDDMISSKLSDLEVLENRSNGITQSLDIVFSDNTDADLSVQQCTDIIRSHILRWRLEPLISAEELIASGNLNIIQNEILRSRIMNYSSLIQTHASELPVDRAIATVIADNFPAILERGWDGSKYTSICHIDEMRVSNSFINALLSNMGRMDFFMSRTGAEIELLQEIQSLLDSEYS